MVLLTLVRVCTLLFVRVSVSAPEPARQPPVGASVLAAVMASTRVQVLPSMGMVAASARRLP